MVAIVYIQDIRYCPYLSRYTDALQEQQIPFDLIWWERWATPPKTPLPEATKLARACYVFNRASEMSRSPVRKVADFAAFSRYVRTLLKKERYDKLILLTTMSAMVLGDLLTGSYKGRYIFDIRDYSYEKLPGFRAIEGKLVDCAAFTCISSEGFREFLPRGREYVLTDNYFDGDLERGKFAVFRKKPEGEPLILSYVGFIRYFQENRKILERLLGDSRFLLYYHGAGADYDKLLEYQAQKNTKQLVVTGYFDYATQKAGLCQQADIINNFYPSTLEIQRLATTNKTYDAIIYRKPQLVSAGTFSEQLVHRWNIGCALDVRQPDFADRLYEYYHSLDEERFNRDVSEALRMIRERDLRYREKIRKFLVQPERNVRSCS